jgi:hypothetical protein
LGPTSCSWSLVLRQWILPAGRMYAHTQGQTTHNTRHSGG